VALQVEDAGNARASLGVTRDMSQTGLYLLSEQEWPIGHLLDARIVHSTRDIEVRCRVARHGPDGVGLQFVELNADQAAAVNACLVDLLARGAWFDERRGALRVPIEGPITWAHGDTEVESQLVDLSPKGARIATDDPPAVASEIVVYVPEAPEDASDGGPGVCGCQATVAHRTTGAMGVEFVNPTDEFLKAVRHILVSGAL
jgi:hypothetical protein